MFDTNCCVQHPLPLTLKKKFLKIAEHMLLTSQGATAEHFEIQTISLYKKKLKLQKNFFTVHNVGM